MPTKHISYKEGSRNNWGQTRDANEGDSLTIEQINCGALLRIADALEDISRRLNHLGIDRQALRTAQSDARRYKRLNDDKLRKLKALKPKSL